MDKNWDNYKLMRFFDKRFFENVFVIIIFFLGMYFKEFDWYLDNSRLIF